MCRYEIYSIYAPWITAGNGHERVKSVTGLLLSPLLNDYISISI